MKALDGDAALQLTIAQIQVHTVPHPSRAISGP